MKSIRAANLVGGRAICLGPSASFSKREAPWFGVSVFLYSHSSIKSVPETPFPSHVLNVGTCLWHNRMSCEKRPLLTKGMLRRRVFIHFHWTLACESHVQVDAAISWPWGQPAGGSTEQRGRTERDGEVLLPATHRASGPPALPPCGSAACCPRYHHCPHRWASNWSFLLLSAKSPNRSSHFPEKFKNVVITLKDFHFSNTLPH